MRILQGFSGRLRRRSTVFTLALCGVIVASVWSLVPADLVAPRPNDRHVTTVVLELLRREHLSRHPLDDEISKRGLESFLETLDPIKMYFYESDVAEILKHEDEVDDMLKERDISLAYITFQRFLKRVDERVELIDELLKQEFDFTRDETMITDPDEARYPRDQREARERWKHRIKYDLLVLKSDDKEGKEARDKLHRRYHSFAKRMHQTDGDDF